MKWRPRRGRFIWSACCHIPFKAFVRLDYILLTRETFCETSELRVWCSTSNVLLGKYELFVSVLRQDDHRFCAIFFAPFQIAKVGGALRGILTVLEEDPNSFFVTIDLL